ncbi:2,5-dichloro-2,5-cyclohexadiene-1,4-diol dehydrogenase [Fonsecaea pedrosoi]|nr:2,5-dichloro-2,5-cyclohexadiene-1,4-diol dehydrogenase [Fonsecaea pedrosoi]
MDGKVIAITGGSSGIGKATARILASRGAKLSIADWNATSLAQLSAEFSSQYPDFLYTQLDVTQRAKVDDWIAQTVQHFGRLDGAANCAGVTGRTNDRMPLTEVDDEHWDVAIGVNLTGTMACLRAQLRAIVDGGSIVSIASVAGLEGIAGISPYCAAKHGIIGLTRSAAKEVAQRQIRVNAVAPGTINTPLYQDSMNGIAVPPSCPMGRVAEPQEVAAVLTWLLGPESTFVTGSVYTVDGGWHC